MRLYRCDPITIMLRQQSVVVEAWESSTTTVCNVDPRATDVEDPVDYHAAIVP